MLQEDRNINMRGIIPCGEDTRESNRGGKCPRLGHVACTEQTIICL
jgi:hypothetical protein